MMKLLCYVLCLLNFGYLLWQFHEGGLNPTAPQPSHYSSILLVSEYARAQRGAVISSVLDQQSHIWKQAEVEHILNHMRGVDIWIKRLPVVVSTKSVKPHEPMKVDILTPKEALLVRKCYQVGPFANEALVRQWLSKNALKQQQLLHKDAVLAKDFQVYYPAAKTPEQSRLDKMLLLAKGRQDIWTIPSGELKGGYSLGVFSDKQHATVFKNQLAEQGIRAEIHGRGGVQTEWFVTIMLDKNQLQQIEHKGIELVSCVDR